MIRTKRCYQRNTRRMIVSWWPKIPWADKHRIKRYVFLMCCSIALLSCVDQRSDFSIILILNKQLKHLSVTNNSVGSRTDAETSSLISELYSLSWFSKWPTKQCCQTLSNFFSVNVGDSIDYHQHFRENVGDLVQETLEVLEKSFVLIENQLQCDQTNISKMTKIDFNQFFNNFFQWMLEIQLTITSAFTKMLAI